MGESVIKLTQLTFIKVVILVLKFRTGVDYGY